ncbi:MAG: signal peptidase I [Pararhodobacter sp.]
MASTETHRGQGWWETVKTVFWALALAFLFRSFLYQPFWIPSGSMKETLLIGDFLVVNKFAYGWSRWSCPLGLCPIEGRLWGAMPERGDIAVFRHPVSGDDYVKRLIGLPGDSIRLENGVIYLNGTPLEQRAAGAHSETYVPQGPGAILPRCQNRPLPGGECLKARAMETLPGGHSYPVLNITDRGAGDRMAELTVPEGHVFVIGDNRDNSLDSRFPQRAGGVGFVPVGNLIGRAERVLFSAAGSSLWAVWTWRSDRFFQRLH